MRCSTAIRVRTTPARRTGPPAPRTSCATRSGTPAHLHFVCKPEYCELDRFATIIGELKNASAGVSVLGAVDADPQALDDGRDVRRGAGHDGGGDGVVGVGASEQIAAVVLGRSQRGGHGRADAAAFTFAKQLGVGLTGSVYKVWRKVDVGGRRSSRRVNMMAKAEDEKDGKFAAVAVKVMDKAKILEINETAHVVQESKIMKSVSKHPFIISMLESFQTPSAMFIVMEYAAGRDMFFMIHERGTLTLFQTRAYITQVTLALDHVHSKGFIYRDLKPENLLFDAEGYLKVVDFGFAKIKIGRAHV